MDSVINPIFRTIHRIYLGFSHRGIMKSLEIEMSFAYDDANLLH